MTNFTKIYDAFLAKILEDEWEDWEIDLAKEDWRQILNGALPWFKFPKQPLDLTDEDDGFTADLSNQEIQIIANYMKCEWLNRCIMAWDTIKPLYTERDFSQANLIDKLMSALEKQTAKAEKLESTYYRSRDGKPFDFTRLATKLYD